MDARQNDCLGKKKINAQNAAHSSTDAVWRNESIGSRDRILYDDTDDTE